MDIKGLPALVTGGGRGLGAALAKALARKGARVVMTARHADELEQVTASIRAHGGEAHALVSDMGQKEAAYPLAGAAAMLVGPIELLIHNASTLGPVPLPLLLDTDCEELEQVLQTNLVGPFRLTKIVAGSMALRRRGAIIHISSDAAVNAYPRWGVYGISKAAQDQLSATLAAELGSVGVRSLAVDPGEMDTQMHAYAVPDADRSTLACPDDVAVRIVSMIEHLPSIPNGTRLRAASWVLRS
jgi:NAD(P)-dependent dehydrogenase (short-subunit alcohol dehydrogenase family)